MTESNRAHPPETTGGWYVFHQIVELGRAALRGIARVELDARREKAASTLEAIARPSGGGWSAVVPLIGSRADVMLMHFRPTLDDIGVAQQVTARLELFDAFRPVYSFLSVTEAGLYHATAAPPKEAAARST